MNPNPQSSKTNITLDLLVKELGLELAKTRYGDSGTLSLLIRELIKEAYKKEIGPIPIKKSKK